uniref:Uncharacterized protein n=1 Tax=Cucumis melo TaxID=3656 RepID=A0A9I9CUP6_CUCME
MAFMGTASNLEEGARLPTRRGMAHGSEEGCGTWLTFLIGSQLGERGAAYGSTERGATHDSTKEDATHSLGRRWRAHNLD